MSLTNADLVQQVSGLIAKWDTYTQQLRDWLAGTPSGGPYGDGRYPLQDSLGRVFYVPCPAAQAASVGGNVDSALAYSTAASESAAAAGLAKTGAEAARDLALTYRDAAQAAKLAAEQERNQAANSEANALVHRNAAQASASSAAQDAASALQAAAEAEADRVAAEAARVAAEAAAAAAQTFDPAQFYTKTQADSRYAAATHNHDSAYAAKVHTHSGADITSGTVADARLPTTMGSKTFTGRVTVEYGTSRKGVEMWVDTTYAYAHIDLHSSNTAYNDYDARIAASGAGPDGTSGGATLIYTAAGHTFNVTPKVGSTSVALVGHTHVPADIAQDANNRFVTDAEKAAWNAKQNALGYTPVNKAGDTMTGALTVNRGTSVADTVADLGALNGSHSMRLHARLGAGSYNPSVAADDKALIFHNGSIGTGSLFIGPWDNVGFGLKIKADGNHAVYGNLAVSYDLSVATGRKMFFGAGVGQKLNLWNEVYGIGIQNNTMYFRAGGTSVEGFAWFKGGAHSDAQRDPGTGGTLLMSLDSDRLTVGTNIVGRDITADRGNNTGVIFLNGAQTRYVYFDGSNYVMPGANLFVNGAPVKTGPNNTLVIPDTRGYMIQPNQYTGQMHHWDFKNTNDTGAGGTAWHVVMTVCPWVDFNVDHRQQQLCFTGQGMSYRRAVSSTAWSSWAKVVQSPQAQQIHVMATDPAAAGYAVYENDLWIG